LRAGAGRSRRSGHDALPAGGYRCRGTQADSAPALNNLFNRLGDVGRHEQALGAIEEEVTIRRLLAASSAGYEPDLASLLQSLAVRLAQSTDTRKLTKLG
jgi:hypothetical protein